MLAAADHETASSDHTLAGSDHTTAAADHTQAGNDHTASTTATNAANDAASLANDKAALAVEKAALADEKATEAGNVNATLNGTEITVTNRYGVSVTQNIKGDKGNPGTTDYEQLVHKPDLTVYVTAAEYDETTHYLKFKNSEGTVITSVDAAPFIKDGMVDSVEVTGGNLVITFNTDAGKQAISIPLTAIFNPANYYDKTATDALLLDKLEFDPDLDPTDAETLQEFNRVLTALYQALNDAQAVTDDTLASKRLADAATANANSAADRAYAKANEANSAAQNANDKAGYAKDQGDYAKQQGDAAKNIMDAAKGDYDSLDARLDAIEESGNIEIEINNDPGSLFE